MYLGVEGWGDNIEQEQEYQRELRDESSDSASPILGLAEPETDRPAGRGHSEFQCLFLFLFLFSSNPATPLAHSQR